MDALPCDIQYTNNNQTRYFHKGVNELLDIKFIIDKYNIQDEDIIIKLTGRYYLTNDTFFKLVIENPYIDIFIHHSAISVLNQQYKYLVQGEYVEFSLVSTQGGVHEFNAANVSGIKGGKLMCETRMGFKNTKPSFKVSERFGSVFDDVTNDNDNLKFKRAPPIQISPRHNRYFSVEKQEFTFTPLDIENAHF